MTTYQIMPELSQEDYLALKQDIAERGIQIPIEIDAAGNILDGHHRLRAWKELRDTGWDLQDKYPRVVRLFETEEQKRNHIRALNILRRHLTKEQRDDQWAAMRADGMSYRQIAEVSGVAPNTVRSATVQNCTVQPTVVIGKDGKKRKPTKPYKEKAKPPQAPVASFFVGTDEDEEKAKLRAKKIADTGSEGASQPVNVTMFSSETNEYYTPPQYVEAAREVMCGIDLDPASNEQAQEWIQADTFYTIADDGLNQPWFGRVWLNPPYGKEGNNSNQELWSQRLVAEYREGNVAEAVLLVKAALGYNWFENLWWNWPVCFARERLSFIRSNGDSKGQSKQGTAFLYLGENVARFRQVFRQFGRVIMPENEENGD